MKLKTTHIIFLKIEKDDNRLGISPFNVMGYLDDKETAVEYVTLKAIKVFKDEAKAKEWLR